MLCLCPFRNYAFLCIFFTYFCLKFYVLLFFNIQNCYAFIVEYITNFQYKCVGTKVVSWIIILFSNICPLSLETMKEVRSCSHIMSAKKCGFPDSPYPPCQAIIRNWHTPSPPQSEKSENLLSLNLETILACVKYEGKKS